MPACRHGVVSSPRDIAPQYIPPLHRTEDARSVLCRQDAMHGGVRAAQAITMPRARRWSTPATHDEGSLMNAFQFDTVARAVAALLTRRHLLGVAIGGTLTAAGLADTDAKKHRKKPCGPCKTRKKGKCKPKPDGIDCGTGEICRRGQCQCQQPCNADRECLANGSCGRVCPETFDCGMGCGCGLPTVEGPVYCIVSEGGCETFTQGCESTAECPLGQVCMTTFCATEPFNRCISLCPS
jgi:hypothetical protein